MEWGEGGSGYLGSGVVLEVAVQQGDASPHNDSTFVVMGRGVGWGRVRVWQGKVEGVSCCGRGCVMLW